VWLARKYRLALSPEQKRQFELKVLAESIFKGNELTSFITIIVGEKTRKSLYQGASLFNQIFLNINLCLHV